MVVGLKNVGYVHAFLIVMNSEEPRLSEHMQETIKLFGQMFSLEFFQNALFVFTKFAYDKSSVWKRQQGKKMTEA
jgi:hypothetical protein